ncbi:AAA ATPase-like protein [Umezawaea tangerina]|uniref:AAA ATPase-like protein n=2 Tax=Umezawaea tangerina TaxID=84725 RepID=A0A2T0T481_9PSEU|nr:AAA ATPase-like protein [Umezawaea tangerina]
MSQGELARRVNYSKSHLSRVESGDKRPTSALARLCDNALDVDGELLDYLQHHAHLSPAVVPSRFAQLPAATVSFTGRQDVLATLDDLLDRRARSESVIISGPPGVGKTALAVHWAYRVARRFAHGVLYSDLGGFDGEDDASPSAVLKGFLLALGVAPEAIPAGMSERAAAYRDLLANRQVLVVLDNAASVKQVRPLLAGSVGGSLVVMTSRLSLTGLTIREGARTIVLKEMGLDEAVQYVQSAVLDRRVVVSPVLATRLAQLCECLPLALAIVVHRLSRAGDADAAHLVSLLERRSTTLLDVLSISGDDSLSVRGSLWWSYRALSDPLSQALRLISTYAPNGIDVDEAASLLNVTSEVALTVLESLAAVNLIRPSDKRGYSCSPMVATFVADLVSRPDLAS